jgi:hypothetical protein
MMRLPAVVAAVAAVLAEMLNFLLLPIACGCMDFVCHM